MYCWFIVFLAASSTKALDSVSTNQYGSMEKWEEMSFLVGIMTMRIKRVRFDSMKSFRNSRMGYGLPQKRFHETSFLKNMLETEPFSTKIRKFLFIFLNVLQVYCIPGRAFFLPEALDAVLTNQYRSMEK
ncbi:hypothetical protein CDAR_221851 [Caerostris darwini]|uniref:Uncharacterized protein n=1 Tax=Caerostris darwini TaxID=1538125 RepID=A0AAV4MZC0_9ARAC|nr:hypothetical protein CDAR_221851 [Caerostris darwini]